MTVLSNVMMPRVLLTYLNVGSLQTSANATELSDQNSSSESTLTNPRSERSLGLTKVAR